MLSYDTQLNVFHLEWDAGSCWLVSACAYIFIARNVGLLIQDAQVQLNGCGLICLRPRYLYR